MEDRRARPRCPECQGPAVLDENYPEGVRCRVSVCVHNHSRVSCPRCGAQDLESVHYESGIYKYTCRDCTHHWEQAG